MGVKYAEGVILDMEKMWEESTIRVPMICFQSMGSDPSNDIEMLAKKHKISKPRDIQLSSQNHLNYYTSLLSQHVEQYPWDRVRRCMLGGYSNNVKHR